jgi:hypothetical protein
LGKLSASEVKILNKIWVEGGEAVKDDADDQEEIQEGGEYDPPAVIRFAAGGTRRVAGLD